MKKILTILFIFSITSATVFGQNIFPATGNVGAKTITPVSELQVNGVLSIGGGATINAKNLIQIKPDNTVFFHRIIFGADATPGAKFGIAKNIAGTVTDLLTVLDNGNVGFSIVAPTYKVEWSNGTHIGFLDFSFTGNAIGSKNGNLGLWAGGSEKFTLLTNGNVGIGIIAPTTKLDVNGAINTNSTINATGAITGGTITSINLLTAGSLKLPSTLQTIAGTAIGVDANGLVGKVTIASGASGTSSNGLTTTAGNTVLGGALTQATTIAAGANNLLVTGIAGINSLSVLGNGNVGIGTTAPTGKLEAILTATPSSTQVSKISDYVDAFYLTRNTNIGKTAIVFRGGDGIGSSIESGRENEASNWGSYFSFKTRNTITSGNTNDLTEKLRITADGNIGIGTPTPTAKLDVAGDINTNTKIITPALNFSGNGASIPTTSTTTGLGIDGATGNVVKYTIGAGSNTSGWTASGQNTITSGTGKVGIGTATPSKQLEIGGGRPMAFDASLGSIKIRSDVGGWAMNYGFTGSSGTDNGGFWGSGTADNLVHWSIGKTNTDYTFVVKPTGFVGIGTSAPTAKLDVAGDINTNTKIITPALNFSGNGASIPSTATTTGLGIDGATGNVVKYTINTSNWAASGQNSIFSGTGNVGIGTANPTEKLEIGGNIFLNGNSPKLRFNEPSVAAFNTGIFGTSINNSRYSISSLATNNEVFSIKYLDGNVGIGTASPNQKLEVAGIARFTGLNGFSIGADGNQNRIQSGHTTGQLFRFLNAGNGMASVGAGSIAIGTTFSDVNTAPPDGLIVQGNVGIGTITPTAKLDVAGDINTNTKIITPALNFSGNGASIPTAATTTGLGIDGATGNVVKYTIGAASNTSGWTASGQNTITSGTGNVGIGIAAPTVKFEVKELASAGLLTTKFTTGNGDNNFNIGFRNGYGTGINSQQASLSFNYVNTYLGGIGFNRGSTSDLEAITFTTGNTLGQSEKMRIISNGNVGIGTNDPTAKLSVNGNFNILGNGNTTTLSPSGYTTYTGEGIFDPLAKPSLIAGTVGASDRQFIVGYRDFGNGFYWPRIGFRNGTVSKWSIGGANIAGDFSIGKDNSGSLDYLVINTVGNIGIGNIAPAFPLDVNGIGKFKTRVFIDDSKGQLFGDGTAFGTTINDLGLRNDAGNIVFAAGSATPDLTIIPNGNVGIGTTAPPAFKLDVVGDINTNTKIITPALNFSGNGASVPTTATTTGLGIDGATGNVVKYTINTSNWAALGQNSIFSGTGNVGIGTSSPTSLLNIVGLHQTTKFKLTLPAANNGGNTGEINLQGWVSEPGNTYDGGGIGMNVDNNLTFSRFSTAIGQSYIRFLPNGGKMNFYTANNNGTVFPTMMLDNGKVGIGTATVPGTHKLAVAGSIIAEEVLIKLQNAWPDYVFSNQYKLKPLAEVEQFVKTNNHLPEIPSSKQVEAQGGQQLGEMNRLLLQKVEELTLYLIDQNRKLEMQQKEIDILKTKIDK